MRAFVVARIVQEVGRAGGRHFAKGDFLFTHGDAGGKPLQIAGLVSVGPRDVVGGECKQNRTDHCTHSIAWDDCKTG